MAKKAQKKSQQPKKAAAAKTQKRSVATKAMKKTKAKPAFVLPAAPAFTTSLFSTKKQSKRSMSTAAAGDEQDEYDAIQAKHDAFTDAEKDQYNEWIAAKLSPVLRRSFYGALAISRAAPAQPQMPDDEFIIQDLLETLTAHNLLIPKDSKVQIPEPTDAEDFNNQVLDDLMFVLKTFKIIPHATLEKFKKGYINPNIEFNEGDFATNPFDAEAELHLTPEEIEQDGDLYTLGDLVDTTLKIAGFYDVVTFQKDEGDKDLQLPPQPQGETAKTSFAQKRVELFPFHEDPSNPFVQEADAFHQDYLEKEDDVAQLMDYHQQFYRHDVASTLHEEVHEVYERVLAEIDAGESAGTKPKIDPADMGIFKGIIRDFYLQTSLYQNYLSDPDPKFPLFNINMDFGEQMKQIYEEQQQEGGSDGADEAFVQDKKH